MKQGSHAVGQEWRWRIVACALHFNIMCGEEVIYEGCTSDLQGHKLCDAHNAAVAAEREKSVNVLRERVLEFAEQSGSQIKRIRDLEHQLDEEREKAKVGKDL